MPVKLSLEGRVFLCFWIFGLVNNVLYVVILSAAVDLVGPSAPKAIVLLADVLPSFIFKLSAPYFIHRLPYKARIFALVALSFFGMNIIAFSDSLSIKLFGIVLASLSSGLGETTFLQLTHFYETWSLAGFSSGTGAAGLAGSFVFLVLTTWIGLSANTSLISFSVVPFSFLIVYGWLLPAAPVKAIDIHKYQPLNDASHVSSSGSDVSSGSAISGAVIDPDLESQHDISGSESDTNEPTNFSATLAKVSQFFLPYMLPLILVYIGEYIINQGISPTLLFPIEEMPFSRYRDAYVTYGTLYQFGVFISRSSSPFFRVRKLYVPAVLQLVNLVICILQSLYMPIPNIYLIMALIFYEGLLGGLAYVNTFLLVSETVPPSEREFAMGAVTVSDSAGIVVAALVSMYLEKALCRYQLRTGRPWCELD